MRKSAPLFCALLLSLYARRAWIEIPSGFLLFTFSTGVALRKESVDRNYSLSFCPCVPGVALRKESVDRNVKQRARQCNALESLSARRAWIEITVAYNLVHPHIVALRKESVDRNTFRILIIHF